jgi:hypothetical protein
MSGRHPRFGAYRRCRDRTGRWGRYAKLARQELWPAAHRGGSEPLAPICTSVLFVRPGNGTEQVRTEGWQLRRLTMSLSGRKRTHQALAAGFVLKAR